MIRRLTHKSRRWWTAPRCETCRHRILGGSVQDITAGATGQQCLPCHARDEGAA